MAVEIGLKNNFFEKYDQKVLNQVKELVRNAAYKIEAEAKRACPVDTGNLRASINTQVSDYEAAIGTNVEYAAFIQFGTKKRGATPYLYPALKQVQPEFEERLRDILLGGKK